LADERFHAHAMRRSATAFRGFSSLLLDFRCRMCYDFTNDAIILRLRVIARRHPVNELARFGVSMEKKLLHDFDRRICSRGYGNRSEAIRDLIRDRLVELAWEGGTGDVVGTLTIVYDHHVRDLTDRLTDIQHKYHASIIASTHAHLTHHTCLEVIILRGSAQTIRKIADALLAAKGVRHGKLVSTTTAEEF